MRRPLRALAALAAVGALALTACSDRNSQPTELDEQRLAALADAPPFDAATYDAEWVAEPADGAFRSLNWLANRGELRLTADAPAASTAAAWPGLSELATTIAAEATANGWELVGVACIPPDDREEHAGTIVVALATELDDGSVAAGTVRIGDAYARIDASFHTAYHDEPDDPWDLAPIAMPACVEAGTPPADRIDAGTVGIDEVVLYPEDRAETGQLAGVAAP